MDTIQFRLRATNDQVEDMNRRCEMSEQLFALTLATRLQGLPREEMLPIICDWFRTVRHMAHANYIVSGIQVLPPVEREQAIAAYLTGQGIQLTEEQWATLGRLIQ